MKNCLNFEAFATFFKKVLLQVAIHYLLYFSGFVLKAFEFNETLTKNLGS